MKAADEAAFVALSRSEREPRIDRSEPQICFRYTDSSMGEARQAVASGKRAQLLGYMFLCLIWGSTWLAIRILVADVPPLRGAAQRFVLAAVLLLVPALLRGPKWPQGGREWNAIIVLSFTMMAVPYGLLFWAEQYVTSSMSAVLFSAAPLVVALLTPLMTRHTVPRSAVFAMVIAFGALLNLFYRGLSTTPMAVIGGGAVLLAMVVSSWSVVYAKVRLHNVEAVISTGLQFLFGAVALFWGTWALEPHRPSHWTRSAVLALIFLATLGSAAAFAVYYWLLKRMRPYQLSTISMIVPVIAVVEGSVFQREPIPLSMIAAMLVVLGSVAFVLRAEAHNGDILGSLLAQQDKAE